MLALVSVFTLLLAVLISFLIIRVATVALTLTGMATEAAKFQARSAYLGVGFTTSESEAMVNHPLRRRILMQLMLAGNIGAVTVLSTLLISFVHSEDATETVRCAAILGGGLLSLFLLIRSQTFDRALSRLIRWCLARITDLESPDLGTMLHLYGDDYGVAELVVRDHGSLHGHTLDALALDQRGLVVLGVADRHGSYHGVPPRDQPLDHGDVVVVYGPATALSQVAKDG